MERERIAFIDGLKGFAALLVVLGHISDGYLGAGLYPQDDAFLSGLYNGIYSFHMPLFIIISGFLFEKAYVLQETGGIKKERLKMQLLNLIGIYFLFSIVLILAKMIFSGVVNNQTSWTDILLLFAKPWALCWYIYVLIELYLIFSIRAVRRLPESLLVPLLLAVNLVGNNLFTGGGQLFQIHRICYYLIFFYVGMLIYCHRKLVIFSRWFVALLGASALVLCICFWSEERKINSIPVINLIVGMGFSVVLFFLFERNHALAEFRLFQLCGKYSLEIYLLHCNFTAGLRPVFSWLGIENVYLSVCLNLVISVTASILIAVLCKKLHLHTLLFKPATWLKSRKDAAMSGQNR